MATTTKITMKLEGFEKLQRNITQAPDRLKAYSTDAVKVTAFSVAQRMRASAPYRTGRLKGAIETVPTGLTGRVLIRSEGFYWKFLEYGTSRMAAQPFIRPSAESEQNPFISRVREIGDKLERDWAFGRLL